MFFNALNDGVDQTFRTFFLPVLLPLNCGMDINFFVNYVRLFTELAQFKIIC